MVAAALLRLAPIALRGLGGAGKALVGPAKNFPGGMVGQEIAKYTVIAPVAGAAMTSLGLPWGYKQPPPPMPAPAGGMNPRQMDFMYGELGAGPFGTYLPWQNKGPGFMDRQLQMQERVAMGQQSTFLQGLQHSNNTRMRMADFTSARNLEGLKDTNQSRIRMANLELSGLQDTNRSRIRMAEIGANRDRYVADRSVEVARWGGAPMRIATFGSLMR